MIDAARSGGAHPFDDAISANGWPPLVQGGSTTAPP
jgi:hypothetical protein